MYMYVYNYVLMYIILMYVFHCPLKVTLFFFCRVRNEVGFNYNNCFYLMNNINFLGVNCESHGRKGSNKKKV